VASLCNDCARWFFGYKDTVVSLPDPIKKPKNRTPVADTTVPCPTSPLIGPEQQTAYDTKSTKLCATVQQQFSDGLQAQVQQAWSLWDALYMPSAGASQEQLDRQTLMHTAILVTLSAEAICKANDDGLIHRHDAPKIAYKHAAQCYSGADWCPAGKLLMLQTIVGQTIVERLLKQKILLGMARKLFSGLPAVGSFIGYQGESAIQAVVTLSAQLFQVINVNRPLQEEGKSFGPEKAYSYLGQTDKGRIFEGGTGPHFSDEAEYQIGSLHHAMKIRSTLVPLFNDGSIDPNLPQMTKDYLNMLPKMDNVGPGAVRSACEIAVRRKVISQLRNAFEDSGNLDAVMAGQFPNIAAQFLATPGGNAVPLGNWDDLLDALIQDLSGTRVYLEHTFGPGLTTVLTNRWDTTSLLSDYKLNERDLTWGAALPLCMPGDNTVAFKTVKMAADDLRRHQDARTASADFYWDWRVDKDHTLYDGFIPSVGAELGYQVNDYSHMPIFTSLSPSVCPPLPNYTSYGANTIVLNPDAVRNRCIFTLGDRRRPRRSMLLLLFDLSYDLPYKYGSNAAMGKKNATWMVVMLYHLEMHTADYATGISANLRTEIQQGWMRYPPTGSFKADMATDAPYAVYRGAAFLPECHIFGEVKPSRDAVGVLLSYRTIKNENDDDAQRLRRVIAEADTCASKLFDFGLVKGEGIPTVQDKLNQASDNKFVGGWEFRRNLDNYQ
jgi:hypothetical protein